MVESRKQLGKVGFDLNTGIYWGEILHLCGIERFQAESIDELRQMLRESIDDTSAERGASGWEDAGIRFEPVALDVDPTLYYQLNQQALLQGKNVSQYIIQVLRAVVDESQRPELV